MMKPRRRRPTERDVDDPRNAPVILRKELNALGHHDRAIAAMVRSGQLARVRRGAYASGSVYTGLDEAGRYGLVSRAAVKQAKTDVVLSHLSAAVEYDAPTWGLDLRETHLTRTDGRTGRREAGIAQHCGTIEDGDVVERNGLRVMNGTRTALEVTTVAALDPSVVVVSHLLNLGHTTENQLLAHYGRMAEWPGSGKTDLVMRLADARFESIGETRTYLMLFRAHIDMPEPQYKIHDHGVLVAELDFAWPDLGVWLEFDGFVKYEKLLQEGETSSEVVVREKRREDLVRRLTGWECIRLTWADLAHPERTAAMIRRKLEARAAA